MKIIYDIENDIKKICKVEIYKSKRESREYNGKMKYSFRLFLKQEYRMVIFQYHLKKYLINMILLINLCIIEIEYYLLLWIKLKRWCSVWT